jgi:hypothetical protein
MKIECEVPDVRREDIIESMAAQLLGALYEGDEDDPEPRPTYDRRQIGKHLRVYFDKKIAALAAETVRAAFDDTIRARIAAEVDEVLRVGWQATNEYGEPRGERLDLKARISNLLTQARGNGYNRELSVMDAQMKAATEGFLSKELKPIIDDAKANLRKCLDATVMKTVADTITNAVGLR